MNKKIKTFQEKPLLLHNNKKSFEHKLQMNLPILKASLVLYFSTFTKEEQCICNISFELNGDISKRGIIDLYLQMINNRAIEALDRVSIKELDHFLRDDTGEKVFEYYEDYLYEILGIGEYIINFLKPNKNNLSSSKLVNSKTEFLNLSFSEQVEIFEELLTKHFYTNNKFHDYEVNLEDVSESYLELECDNNKDLILYLKKTIAQEIGDFDLRIRNYNS